MALTAKNKSTVRLPWNRFPTTPPSRNGEGSFQSYAAIWDSTTDGNLTAHATAGMGLGVFLPPHFIVTRVIMDVLVLPVGPTNMYFSLEDDADLVASAAIAGAPYSTTGVKTGAQTGAQVTAYTTVSVAFNVAPVRTTNTREIVIGCTVANTSAGRIAIFVQGWQSYQLVQGAAQ